MINKIVRGIIMVFIINNLVFSQDEFFEPSLYYWWLRGITL